MKGTFRLIGYSLLFDGQRINDTATAADLDLEDGDSLEVLLERTLSFPCLAVSPSEILPRLIHLTEVGGC